MRELVSVPHRHRVDVLTPEDRELLHRRALDVLERVGVTTTNQGLLRLLQEHGQSVDLEAGRVRFDPAFVQERLAMAAREVTLTAREDGLDLVLDGSRGFLSTDGCPGDLLDLETGKRRPGTKADLRELTRLADAIPQISFLWQCVSANDTPVPVRPIHETHAQLTSTTKHIQQMTAVDGFNATGIVEMARAIAGDADAFRARPFLSNFQCVISPLHWDEGPVDAMRVFAEAGVPMGLCSMPLAAASAPVTLAGTLAMVHAEILSGIAILQTLVPGATAFYVGYPTTIDLQTGAMNPVWSYEESLMAMAANEMGRHLGMATGSTCMSAGSKRTDWQAGAQTMLISISDALSPADLLSGAGGLHGNNVFSHASLLLDCEVFDMAARWAEGLRITDDDIAVDVIEAVGPGGHFLDQEHTLTQMRTIWRESLMDRRSWDAWETEGRPDPPVDAATQRAKELLAEHGPEPLADDLAAELDRIVGSFEAQAVQRAG
ncbi:MAG TPA: trimethylamine methyltransferase family protein [Actinomycetota bacterium]